jgi:hypothetical protein
VVLHFLKVDSGIMKDSKLVRVAVCVGAAESRAVAHVQPDAHSSVIVLEVGEDIRGGNVFDRAVGLLVLPRQVVSAGVSGSGMWLVLHASHNLINIHRLPESKKEDLHMRDTMQIHSINEDEEMEMPSESHGVVALPGPVYSFSLEPSTRLQRSRIRDCLLSSFVFYFPYVRAASRGLRTKDNVVNETPQFETLAILPRTEYYWTAFRYELMC